MDTATRHARVAPVQEDDWGECLLPLIPKREVPRAFQDEMRAIVGVVPPATYWLAVAPWVARGACLLVRSTSRSISPRAGQLAILVVAQDNSCRFCFSAQRASLKVQGYSDAQIDALQQDFHTADLSDRDLAGLEFIRKVARGVPRPNSEDFRSLAAAGYDRAAIADLCFLSAGFTFVNRVMTLLALPPELAASSLVKIPLLKVMGPLLIRWILSNRRRFRYEAPVNGRTGPAAAVVDEFRGTYAAYTIDRIVAEALASDVLPRRTKLLMMAVVAKAIGCPVGIANAAANLAPEGFNAEEVQDLLTHLTSPRLDALDTRLISLARETVRYQSRSLQRSMADATQGLSPAQICEVAGTLALANALCRLSVVLECSSTSS